MIKKPELEPGDVVRLRSGGPRLTVERLVAFVDYVDVSGAIRGAELPVEALERVPEPEKPPEPVPVNFEPVPAESIRPGDVLLLDDAEYEVSSAESIGTGERRLELAYLRYTKDSAYRVELLRSRDWLLRRSKVSV